MANLKRVILISICICNLYFLFKLCWIYFRAARMTFEPAYGVFIFAGIYLLPVVMIPLILFLLRDKLKESALIICVMITMVLYIIASYFFSPDYISEKLFVPACVTVYFALMFIFLRAALRYLKIRTDKMFQLVTAIYMILVIANILLICFFFIDKFFLAMILLSLAPIILLPGFIYFLLCSFIYHKKLEPIYLSLDDNPPEIKI